MWPYGRARRQCWPASAAALTGWARSRPRPRPVLAEQIRPGDPYELSKGHAIFTPPTGGRGGRANLVGGEVLDTDPNVDSAGVDVGISGGPKNLRAPDVAVGNVPNEPGWSATAPPLAVEYADVGQNEDDLHLKIAELYERVRAQGIREVVVATNPTTTGEATALHIADGLRGTAPQVSVTRLASGLPVGADLEYADELTLGRALLGRRAL